MNTQASSNERDGAKKQRKNFFSLAGEFFPFPALPIILHLAIALFLACALNIWKDEASTLYTTQNFFHALTNAARDEKQAPLYFIILSFWRFPDRSIFFARLFSVFCTAAAIKFFYDAARQFMEKSAARLVCFFFAVHPFLIWASVEIRVYAATILLSVLLLKFFESGYLNFAGASEETAKRSQIIYVLTAAGALYTNYYLGFMLVVGFLVLLALKRYEAARVYFLQMLAVGVVFAPLVFMLERQFSANSVLGRGEEKTIIDGLKILANQISSFVFPIELTAGGAPSMLSIIRVWFVRIAAAALIFLLCKNKFRLFDERVSALAVLAATICAFLLLTYFLLGAEFTVARHFTVLFAPLVLFAGAFAANVLPRRSWIFCAALFALLFPYTRIYKQFPNLSKEGDWARVAAFIEENEKPNQPIIVFPTFDALALPCEYKGANRILPDERFFDWEFADFETRAAEIEFVRSEIPPDAQEIWLATEETPLTDNEEKARGALENFIAENYTVQKTEVFYLEKVRLLRKK